MESIEFFTSVLLALSNPDNKIRLEAENFYLKLKEQDSQLPLYHARVIESPAVESYIKQLSVVLLRRIVVDWNKSVTNQNSNRFNFIVVLVVLHYLTCIFLSQHFRTRVSFA